MRLTIARMSATKKMIFAIPAALAASYHVTRLIKHLQRGKVPHGSPKRNVF